MHFKAPEPPSRETGTEPGSDECVMWQVWAIEYEERATLTGKVTTRVVGVSAESEYGAIKRLCGNRAVIVMRVELIEGRRPQYNERRIEGYIDYEFDLGAVPWEYT